MKKANKKMNKLLKVTLLLCMIFSQLATPIEVLAAEIVPSFELDLTLDTKEDEDPLNDEFVVKNIGDKELVADESYIIEVIRTFEYKDGEKENKTEYVKVLGNELTTGYSIAHETFSYNGVSYVDVNVYEVTDENIDISTYPIEDYDELLTTESVENIMSASFEEGITENETSLEFTVVGDNVLCDDSEGYKCTVTKTENINNLVKISYILNDGDLNPNKDYYVVLKVNGVVSDLVDENVKLSISELEVDFAKLLFGEYTVEYEVRDEENNKVISNVIEFTYEEELVEGQEPTVVDKVEFIKNSELSQEVFFSYSTLSDEEKETLGNDYRFLDNPLAFVFDTLVKTNKEQTEGTILSDYNLFDEEGNRYHVVTSEKFLGAFDEEYASHKVSDVITELNGAIVDLPLIELYVVDENGNKVSNESYIENGMKLVVKIFGETLEYEFLVYGDVDGGYVEYSDLLELINKVLNNNFSYYDNYNLDFNGDSIIDIKDISTLGTYLFEKDYTTYNFEVTDTITPIIEGSEEEIYVGETFEVLLSLDGFVDNYINAIEGLVDYDKEALTLNSIELLDAEIFKGNTLENRFIYASDYLFDANNESIVKLTFTGNVEGNYKVVVNGINLVADGVVVLENGTSNELEIVVNRALHSDATLKSLTASVGRFDKEFSSEVYEYTLYVDSSVNRVTLSGELNDEFATTEDLKEYILTGNVTQIAIDVTAEDGTLNTYRVNVVKVYKSSNNNLHSLTIEGYDIDFDKNTLEYKITVGSDVASLNISAIVEGYGAWVKIEGNENFQEGENIVNITVYAENGSTKTYKLVVNKEAATPVTTPVNDEKEEDKINTEKVVIIVLIVLVVIGLLYLIFKKDEEEEAPRIEQIKPKKENIEKKEEVKHDNNNVKHNNKNNNKPKNKNKGKK